MVFQNSSMVNLNRWMVPSMASGFVSGSASPSASRATARPRSAMVRSISSLKQHASLRVDARAQLRRRFVETHEIDRQERVRVRDEVGNRVPLAWGCFGSVHREIDVRARLVPSMISPTR